MLGGSDLQREGKKVRSFEVAELAQISRSTVSRALAGDPRISKATRERVLAAAAELGYQPNLIARGLKNSTTGIIGVVVTDLNNPYHAHALQLLIEKMGLKHLAPLVFVGNTAEGAEHAIERLMSYQVDAVIALAAPFLEHVIEACLTRSKPLVLMNRYDGSEPVSAVGGDGGAAGRLVADHLVSCRARRFAFFAGEDRTGISWEREQGFSERLKELGHAIDVTISAPYTYRAAVVAAHEMLRKKPDAVFCANDTLAIALMDAARSTGGQMPLIVGYDNSTFAQWPIYDLTSVDQNLDEMTTRTVEIAIAIAREPKRAPDRQMIQPSLVVRGSTSRTIK